MNTLLRKVFLRLLRASDELKERAYEQKKLESCTVGSDVVLYQSSVVFNYHAGKSAISIGAHSRIHGQLAVFGDSGKISIGEDCFLGENSYIWSSEEVTIGNRVLISHGVNVHDFGSHSLSAAARNRHYVGILAEGHPKHLEDISSAPVTIEDDAWLGFNSTVLSGVRIGRGAIVGAGAFVTKDVEPYSIVMGNPAQAVGEARA